MARDGGFRLTSLCFIACSLWLSYSLNNHVLFDKPRLSTFLVLFVSGAVSFAVSFFSTWLPGPDGRFDSEAVLKNSQSVLPQRPRRYYLPCIVVLILVRLELLHRVAFDFQCSWPGTEALLPILFAFYECTTTRGSRNGLDDRNDMGDTIFDDFSFWFRNTRLTLLASTITLSFGAYLATQFAPTSTYFCSGLFDSRSTISLLQWLGLILDATIIILLWRVLSWARTTRARLKTLSGILMASSFAIGLLWAALRILQNNPPSSARTAFKGIGSLYALDILSCGVIIAGFLISGMIWISDSAPLAPAAILTFLNGMLNAGYSIIHVAEYQSLSALQAVVALSIMSTGFSIFLYANSMRSVVIVRRIFIILLLLGTIVAALIFALVKNRALGRHPLDELIYNNRVEADRWLRYATVSTTLHLAVEEYKERNHGRDPPPMFDHWYAFAQQYNSVILDRFDQIEEDILPFWGMTPKKIQENMEKLKRLPDVGIVTVDRGSVEHNKPADPLQHATLDDLVDMIRGFVAYLPNMSIAINLNERPKILAPWDDIHRLVEAGTKSKLKLLSGHHLGKRQSEEYASSGGQHTAPSQLPGERKQLPHVTPKTFRQMQSLTCPPGSKTRSGVNWNIRDHCVSCTEPQSQGQVLRHWHKSLDLCHQPDLANLHSFYMSLPSDTLFQDLLPLFSRSRTDSFSDILIPLARPNISGVDDATPFDTKLSQLSWRGEPSNRPMTHQSLRGGHQQRLVHLINNSTANEDITTLVPIPTSKEKFVYQAVHAQPFNSLLPFDVGFTAPTTPCEETDKTCQISAREFGTKSPQSTLSNRYVLLLDSEDGPSPDTMSTLRSNSVPFISTIFREWYTERLMPWVHFVPIDVRYHGLHSTLAYFTGLKTSSDETTNDPTKPNSDGNYNTNDGQGGAKKNIRGDVLGLSREIDMEGRHDDALWIAEQGKKWANKAMRREDMQIYLFRLLLEWGRVTNERRWEIGYKLPDGPGK